MESPFVKIEDRFYVRHIAAENAGIKKQTLYLRSHRSKEKWGVTKDPHNGNQNLYDWSRLKDEDRDLIKSYYKSEPAEQPADNTFA